MERLDLHTPARPRRRMDLYLFILLLGLGALLAHNRAPEAGPDSREAVVRAGVGQDLLQGLSRGRQGLVGSLRWAPLPTLLAAPLLRAPGVTGTTAMCLVAVAGSACLCVFLSRWWAQYGMRDAIRAPIVFALFLSPPMLRPVFEGTSETVFVFLVIATGAYLIHWWETEDLRSLAYTAVLAGMAALVRYQAVALTLAALAALCVHLVAERRREAYVEGTLITFLTPPLYFVGLWFAANWLIMGDACFFMRGLPGARAQGLLAMIGEACEWQACLLPGLIGVLGWGLCRLAGRKPTVWTGLPVLAACGLLWVEGTRPIQPAPPDPATVELRERVLPHLARHHRADRVVVSGYRGYEIRRATGDDAMYYHELSLYMGLTLERTRGKALYLLAPAPDGDDRWEDVNLKFPGVFTNGARGLIFEKSWRHWSLWRVVRLDTRDQVL